MSDQATQLRRLVEDGRVSEVASLAAILPPSTPRGAVSFRPRPQRRHPAVALPAGRPAPPTSPAAPAARPSPHASVAARANDPSAPVRLARAIAVTSGKGGVGKSNLAVNLAVSLSRQGRKVCLLDADLGMANIDVLCNLTPKITLQHVVMGRCQLTDVILVGPGGFRLIPGASGVAGMADLRSRHRAILLKQLVALERVADDIIIDCAAGISSNVLAFAAAAHTTLVTTTPEPTAVTDAYGMVKSLLQQAPHARVELIVNMVASSEEADQVYQRMNRVTESFLKRNICFAGGVPFDSAVGEAVRHRLPFTLYAPESPATRAVARIARRLSGAESEADQPSRGGFFRRLATWFGTAEDEY